MQWLASSTSVKEDHLFRGAMPKFLVFYCGALLDVGAVFVSRRHFSLARHSMCCQHNGNACAATRNRLLPFATLGRIIAAESQTPLILAPPRFVSFIPLAVAAIACDSQPATRRFFVCALHPSSLSLDVFYSRVPCLLVVKNVVAFRLTISAILSFLFASGTATCRLFDRKRGLRAYKPKVKGPVLEREHIRPPSDS